MLRNSKEASLVGLEPVQGLYYHVIDVVCDVKSQLLSRVQHFVTPWTVVLQAPLSMEFSRQESCSGLPFLSPRNLPNPGIKPRPPTLHTDSLLSEPAGKPGLRCSCSNKQLFLLQLVQPHRTTPLQTPVHACLVASVVSNSLKPHGL